MARIALVGAKFQSVAALADDYTYIAWLSVVEYSGGTASRKIMTDGYCDVIVVNVQAVPDIAKFMDDLSLCRIGPKHIVLVVDDPKNVEIEASRIKISVVTADHLAACPDLVMDYKRS